MKTAPAYKIAVVIPKYGLVGGAEGFAAVLTERIAGNNAYDIHVFANAWQKLSDRITFHHVPIIRFPKFLTTLSFAWFAQQRIARMPFHLIHTHERILNADLYTMHGIPHRVWTNDVRGKRFPSLFDQATVWVEKKMVTSGRCRRFLAVSHLTQSIFLREYPMDLRKVPVIHPGIAVRDITFDQKEKERRTVRDRYGIKPEEVLILFVSMNFDIKGLDAVMAGLGRLIRRTPLAPVKLLVVGKGNEFHYKRVAQQFGIADRVVFAGVVDKSTLDSIYVAGDIYAMLSKFDTFGLVVLEAMAASQPVLISANVGAKDLVREGVNGFVLEDPTDMDYMADKLTILCDGPTRTAMAEAALKTARLYSWDETTKKVEAVYAELLHDRKR